MIRAIEPSSGSRTIAMLILFAIGYLFAYVMGRRYATDRLASLVIEKAKLTDERDALQAERDKLQAALTEAVSRNAVLFSSLGRSEGVRRALLATVVKLERSSIIST